jgi:hypothetical protein
MPELAGDLPIAGEAPAMRPLEAGLRGVERGEHSFEVIVLGLHHGAQSIVVLAPHLMQVRPKDDAQAMLTYRRWLHARQVSMVLYSRLRLMVPPFSRY